MIKNNRDLKIHCFRITLGRWPLNPRETGRLPGRTVIPLSHLGNHGRLLYNYVATCSPTHTCMQKWCILTFLMRKEQRKEWMLTVILLYRVLLKWVSRWDLFAFFPPCAKICWPVISVKLKKLASETPCGWLHCLWFKDFNAWIAVFINVNRHLIFSVAFYLFSNGGQLSFCACYYWLPFI